MKVKCTKLAKQLDDGSTSDGWLTIGRDYDVLEMSFHPQRGTVFRMIGKEPSTPALFSGDLFDVIDSRVPRNWVVVKDKHGVYRFSPAAWLEAGYWERFFDRIGKASFAVGRLGVAYSTACMA